MNSIFKKPSITAKQGRNGFDISQRRLFTASTGQLLPIYCDFANQGDEYKFRPDAFIRTEAVETSAFTRFKAHFDLHFVPMRLMYRFWNEFYNSVFDANTDFVNSSSDFALPKVSFGFMKNWPNDAPGMGTYNAEDNSYILSNDEFGVPKLWNFRRLYDLLGYGNIAIQNTDRDCNLLPFLAYHKIFYSHYNNADWFAKDPSLYNVDSFHGKYLSPERATRIVSTLHYRPWRPDFFSNVFPSPTFDSKYINDLNNLLSSGSELTDYQKNRKSINPEFASLNGVSVSDTSGSSINERFLGDGSSISASDLRSVFALDKLLRVTAMAGSSYDKQSLAHFGVKLPDTLSEESIFIGSHVVDINISEVVASASTGVDGPGSVIGDIAGKGFGTSQNSEEMSFKCTEAGIIMCLFSIEPLIDYDSRSIDMPTRYTRSLDFYHPELDDLGMQPQSPEILNGKYEGFSLTGWQYRYSELKTKFDIVNEGFYATDKASWQTNFQTSTDENNLSAYERNNRFFINPQYANTIFALPFPHFTDSNSLHVKEFGPSDCWDSIHVKPNSIYAGDNFLICSNINAFKTSIMSVHSLPKLV